MQKQKLPPPTQFTAGDKVRIAFAVVILLLGVVILWRSLPLGVIPQAILVGLAFIGFGLYRLCLGYTRLREWHARK